MTLAGLLLLPVALGTSEPSWWLDFESGDGGLVTYGDTSQWEWGVITSGPGGSRDGSRCWATRTGGAYLNDALDFLEVSLPDLAAYSRPILELWHWYDVDPGDAGTFEVDAGTGWTQVEPVYGYPAAGGITGASGGWVQSWLDLAALGNPVRVRLAFSANARVARDGWYVDDLALYDGDVIPPRLEEPACLPDTEDPVGPYPVEVVLEDDVAVTSAEVVWQVDGGAQLSAALAPDTDGRWTGSLPGVAAGSQVTYWFIASDGVNQVEGPDGACAFTVRLPPPTDLVGPTGRVWGTTTELSWTAPETGHAIEGYRVYRDAALVAESLWEEATVPLVTGSQEFTVSAVFDVGEGEATAPLEVEAAVPALDPPSPSEGWPGDRLRVWVTGENLLLEQGDVSVNLGSGMQIQQVEVRDVDSASVEVAISQEAPPGLRDLVLYTGGTVLLLDEAFEVLAGEDRPRLLSVTPDWAWQGDEVQVEITASQPFAAEPEVSVDGVVVQQVALADARTLRVDVAVPWDCPLGDHVVEVDDGTRIYTGLRLQVRDQVRPVDGCGGCASGGAPPVGVAWGLPGLVVLGVLRRRYRQRSRPPSTGMLTPRT